MPVVAICYDFDKTLTPIDMQAQGFIQSLGCSACDFWAESNELSNVAEMDSNLAYMYKMLEKSNPKFTRKILNSFGEKISFFLGVEEWFSRIKDYGKSKGVIVEHYILSSGIKEMIEGTAIAKSGSFERIYSSSYYYNSKGIAVWPAQVVNYTNKTQYLFRISKGVLDVNDTAVNDYFPFEEFRVPFTNMAYIGDSDTDVPCMSLLKKYGGLSIGVYDENNADKTKVNRMIKDGRINNYVPANYTENSPLDKIIKKLIDSVSLNNL